MRRLIALRLLCLSSITRGSSSPSRSSSLNSKKNFSERCTIELKVSFTAELPESATWRMPPGCVASSCVTTLTAFPYPGSLAVDGAGNLYASDGNAVKELPPGCASASCVITLGGWFTAISAVAVDGSGNLYVLDEGAGKEMPPGCTSASCVTTLGGGFGSPAAVTLDGSGNIYVTDNEP